MILADISTFISVGICIFFYLFEEGKERKLDKIGEKMN